MNRLKKAGPAAYYWKQLTTTFHLSCYFRNVTKVMLKTRSDARKCYDKTDFHFILIKPIHALTSLTYVNDNTRYIIDKGRCALISKI